jgi:hypothetical protein
LLEALKARVDEIDTTTQLNNWWRQHSAVLDTLTPADRDALTAHCATRKAALLAALPQRQRGNGEEQPALAIAQG